MLKTIKTTKKVDFFELVKGVQTGIYKHGNYRVVGGNEGSVWVDLGGFILEEPDNKILFTDSFTVEVEEPITDVTLLEKAVYVHKNETLVKDFNTSIDEILIGKHEGSVSKIYALIDGRLELVWERDGLQTQIDNLNAQLNEANNGKQSDKDEIARLEAELIKANETMAAVNAQSNADVEEARTYK